MSGGRDRSSRPDRRGRRVGFDSDLEQGRVCFVDKDHRTLINNNRQAGRRRGRGGQRQGGGNPNAGNGNRIDNRARGNAAQLLEKYKALASDAQRQGDRVNAEYYLQFADHYFRVLAESRSRFEEQNPNQAQRRGREDGFDDDGDEGFEDEGAPQADMDPRREQQSRDDRPYRDDNRQEPRQDARQDRGNRDQPRANNRDRDDRGNRAQGGNNGYANGNAYPANDGDADDDRGNAVEAPVEVRTEREAPRRGRPRREARPVEINEVETFDAALLPPSLGISVGVESDQGSEEAPKPRRGRPRRPAAEAAE
ncbi:MAG: DUF4167 domain-containing protein [Sphingomonas sp.]